MTEIDKNQVIIIGGGFTGLSAAYELVKKGVKVLVLEKEHELGGLAGAFDVAGEKLDRFYHHWFTNDRNVTDLVEELGLTDNLNINPTNTGVYYREKFFNLSTPFDLLKFSPLSFVDRIRLGILTLRARRVSDWKSLENFTAQEWLQQLGGENVYRVMWQPLLEGKFGSYAQDVSAVWFWNKLKLRGGSRGKAGEERLAYYKGSFASLIESLAKKVQSLGGHISLDTDVSTLQKKDGVWVVSTNKGSFFSRKVVFTTALPIVADSIKDWAAQSYIDELNRIKYIGNICLVLELDCKLSKTYWLNVNDPKFPFVGVIEHTNFVNPEVYGGRHIIYLSKYLPHTDPLYSMSGDEFFKYAMPFLKKMFPHFDESHVQNYKLWRERWSQPVVEKHYSQIIPTEDTPYSDLYICSMAQIYPEDRGTNYAIREGRRIGVKLSEAF